MKLDEGKRKYLRKQEVALRYAVCPRTIDRWSREGHLPRPTRQGSRLLLWNIAELDAADAAKGAVAS
jgi:predicted DNA-binding transcriptional regulator AlpA